SGWAGQRPIAGGPFRLRFAGRGSAGFASAATDPCPRRATTWRDCKTCNGGGACRETGAGRDPGAAAGGPADRGAALSGRYRDVARAAARPGRWAARDRNPPDARRSDPELDSRRPGTGGGALPLRLLRPLPPRHGRRADGIPAVLAHG